FYHSQQATIARDILFGSDVVIRRRTLVGGGHPMPKEIKGNASRMPPEPSADHSAIDDWFPRQMPHLQPIVEALDGLIRATIPGLHYAVKWKRPYYGLPELGWIIELAAYDVSVNATRNHRPDPVPQADHPGGGTTTRAAQVDRGGEPHAGLELKVIAP